MTASAYSDSINGGYRQAEGQPAMRPSPGIDRSRPIARDTIVARGGELVSTCGSIERSGRGTGDTLLAGL